MSVPDCQGCDPTIVVRTYYADNHRVAITSSSNGHHGHPGDQVGPENDGRAVPLCGSNRPFRLSTAQKSVSHVPNVGQIPNHIAEPFSTSRQPANQGKKALSYAEFPLKRSTLAPTDSLLYYIERNENVDATSRRSGQALTWLG